MARRSHYRIMIFLRLRSTTDLRTHPHPHFLLLPPPSHHPYTPRSDRTTWAPLGEGYHPDERYGHPEDPDCTLEDSPRSRLGTAMVERVLPSRKSALLSRRWYILLLPQDYLLLPLGEDVAGGGGVEERSEVIYWHRTNTVIYYMYHNGHSCIA